MTLSGLIYYHEHLANQTTLSEWQNSEFGSMCWPGSHDERSIDLVSNPVTSAQRADMNARIKGIRAYISTIESTLDSKPEHQHVHYLSAVLKAKNVITRMEKIVGKGICSGVTNMCVIL